MWKSSLFWKAYNVAEMKNIKSSPVEMLARMAGRQNSYWNDSASQQKYALLQLSRCLQIKDINFTLSWTSTLSTSVRAIDVLSQFLACNFCLSRYCHALAPLLSPPSLLYHLAQYPVPLHSPREPIAVVNVWASTLLNIADTWLFCINTVTLNT